jgi:hypothetical protein
MHGCAIVIVSVQLTRLLKNASERFSSCSSALPYNGEICQQELNVQRLVCLSNSSRDTLNVTVVDQASLEQFGVALFTALPSFDLSPECSPAFLSFFCFFLFGACDTDSNMLATRQMCVDVRDGVCVREWRELDGFLGPGGLPVCEELPEGPGLIPECDGEHSYM